VSIYPRRVNKNIQSGFSLIELIIVITILGILSLTAVPRFFGSVGFSEFAAQQELRSALKVLQTKSMYDSSGTYCYRMIFDLPSQLIGPSTASYSPATAAASCANTIAIDAPDTLTLRESNFDDKNVTFSTSDGGAAFSFVQFDALGRPSTNVGSCASGCQVTISGEQTVRICIGSQGFVREGQC